MPERGQSVRNSLSQGRGGGRKRPHPGPLRGVGLWFLNARNDLSPRSQRGAARPGDKTPRVASPPPGSPRRRGAARSKAPAGLPRRAPRGPLARSAPAGVGAQGIWCRSVNGNVWKSKRRSELTWRGRCSQGTSPRRPRSAVARGSASAAPEARSPWATADRICRRC